MRLSDPGPHRSWFRRLSVPGRCWESGLRPEEIPRDSCVPSFCPSWLLALFCGCHLQAGAELEDGVLGGGQTQLRAQSRKPWGRLCPRDDEQRLVEDMPSCVWGWGGGRGHEPERGIQKFFLLVLEDGRGVTWRLKGVRSWVGPVWGVRHFPEADVVLSLPQQWPCSRCGTGRFTCSMRG